MTQAIGKVPVNMHDVDMASMSGHKIFGPKGIGFLFKSSKVNLLKNKKYSYIINNYRKSNFAL